MNIGRNIKTFRQKAGLTQAQLAERIKLFGAGNISQYENGFCNPSAIVLKDIADALGVTVNDLYSEVKD